MQFPTEVVLSLSTGRLLCKFDKMHECVEFLIGEPIYTHQFASKAFAEHLAVCVIGQQPKLDSPEVQLALGELYQALEAIDQKQAAWATIHEWLLKRAYPLIGEQLDLVPEGSDKGLLRDSFTEPLKGKSVIIVNTTSTTE